MKGTDMPLVSNPDDNLEALSKIHEAVSRANAVADGLEMLMNNKPQDAYIIPTDILIEISGLLKLNAYLVAKLLEENQTIADQVADLLKKHALPTKED